MQVVDDYMSFAIGNVSPVLKGEYESIEKVAQMIYDANMFGGKLEVRKTEFTGGKTAHAVESWPPENCMKLYQDSKVRLARLDWSTGRDYIESIRFTMSNGDVSPKYGVKAFTDCCPFEEPISKVKMLVADRRLVGLTFYTEKDGVYLEVKAPKKEVGAAEHEVWPTEHLLGFNMRVHDKSVTGMSLNIGS